MKFLAGIAFGGMVVLSADAIESHTPIVSPAQADEKIAPMHLVATGDEISTYVDGSGVRCFTARSATTMYSSGRVLDCVYVPSDK